MVIVCVANSGRARDRGSGQVVGGQGWDRASQIVTDGVHDPGSNVSEPPVIAIGLSVLAEAGKCPPGGRELNREVLGECSGLPGRVPEAGLLAVGGRP